MPNRASGEVIPGGGGSWGAPGCGRGKPSVGGAWFEDWFARPKEDCGCGKDCPIPVPGECARCDGAPSCCDERAFGDRGLGLSLILLEGNIDELEVSPAGGKVMCVDCEADVDTFDPPWLAGGGKRWLGRPAAIGG